MGKNQHQKDKIHLTSMEWRRDFGGFKQKKIQRVLPLPFDCCSITLRPFKTPLCSPEGNVFDKKNIIPYLKKYKKCPVTGNPLSKSQLFPLKFHKNANGKFHCPLTFKIFNENSFIVAIKTSGNVYSFEAVKKLNIMPGNWKDILSNESFSKEDIVTIQNPDKKKSREVKEFAHIAKQPSIYQKIKKTGDVTSKNNPLSFDGTRLPRTNGKIRVKNDFGFRERRFSKSYSTPRMATSFTSTSIDPSFKQEMRELTEEEKREEMYEVLKRRKEASPAFVRLQTSHGDMNFALDAKHAPRTCHNFVSLALKGYYDGVIFHRLVPGFMLQGGDPEGTGFGGESAFGGKLKDEFSSVLRHDLRGVISMANSGPNTNGSQFFITFGECSHLDKKHSVFGRLVGGMETLNRIERLRTNEQTEEPLEKVFIKNVKVYSHPFDYDPLVGKDTKECDKNESLVNETELEDKEERSEGKIGAVGKYLKKALGNQSYLG